MWISHKITTIGICILLLGLGAACGPAPAAPAPAAAPATAGDARSQSVAPTQAPAPPVPAPEIPASAMPVAPSYYTLTAPRDVFTASDTFMSLLDDMLEGCIGTFMGASSLNNEELTTTGTLRQLADGTYAYEPMPGNELVLILNSGETTRITISEMYGDLSRNARRLLSNDHQVSCTVNVPNALSLNISSSRAGYHLTQSIQGTVRSEAVDYQIALQSDGTTNSSITGTAMIENDHRRWGTVSYGGISITIDEDYEYKSINFVEQYRRRFRSSWIEGASHYSLQDASYLVAFREGRMIEPGNWQAQGTVFRDGQTIGQLWMEIRGGSGTLLLITEDEQIVLDSW